MVWADLEKKRAYERAYVAKPEVKARRSAINKAWKQANQEKVLAREAKRRLEKRAVVLVATTRTRARNRGLEFDLDQHITEIQQRIDAGRCEVTGEPFDLSPGRKFSSPSIDRLDCKRGYTYDNIRIVINLANAAMGDWGEKTLREVVVRWFLSSNAINAVQAQVFIEAFMDCQAEGLVTFGLAAG